ncbi:MAG: glycosyl hydrolase 2 galactose-binding domain-containing protein, partial [Spirochaetota bacterium]
MEYFSLDGTWTLSTGSHVDERCTVPPGTAIPAEVPGTVHTDLLSAGLIPDPYVGDQERQQEWVGLTDWVYRRSFRITSDFLNADRIELICEGLDTLASIEVNGTLVAKTQNAFHTHTFELASLLKAGENEIAVWFSAPARAAARLQAERFYWHTGIGQERLTGVNHLRKSQSNFGWDWGPRCATAGIWRSIQLRSYRVAALTDVHVRQVELSEQSATLHVTATT